MDGKLSFQLPDFGGRIRKVVVVADSFTQSAKCDDSLTAAALLRTCPDGEQSFTELKPGPQGPACRWWSGSLALLMPTVHYRFLIFSKDGAFWFNGTGLPHPDDRARRGGPYVSHSTHPRCRGPRQQESAGTSDP